MKVFEENFKDEVKGVEFFNYFILVVVLIGDE